MTWNEKFVQTRWVPSVDQEVEVCRDQLRGALLEARLEALGEAFVEIRRETALGS